MFVIYLVLNITYCHLDFEDTIKGELCDELDVERNSWKISATELHYYGSYRFLVCIFGVILTMPLPHCSRVTELKSTEEISWNNFEQ
jgi:hypothetical protein